MTRPDRGDPLPSDRLDGTGLHAHTARRQVVITDPLGLHLRSAEKAVRMAQGFRSDIIIVHKDARANGKSILDLMTLAAECGTTLDIQAHGPDAEDDVAALADLFAAGLDDAGRGDRPVAG